MSEPTVLRLQIDTADDMEALGRRIGALLRAGDLLVLSGGLGAGKTTLTRGIGEAMGVRGPVTSPTFVLSRVHPPVAPGATVPLVHVDAYRLADARELDDLDLDFIGAAVVVEWGDGLLDGVAESWLRIAIQRAHGQPLVGESDEVGRLETSEDNSPRELAIEAFGPGWPAIRLASLARDREVRS